MKKIHTRVKRKFGLSTHLRHYYSFHEKIGANRPKTFSSEELARKWAAQNGLEEGKYSLKKTKLGKRFQVISLTE
jgi:hypothetical protein